MPIVRSHVVVPSRLAPPDKDALVASLYSAHIDIFDGVSRDEFARYVVDSPADETSILVHRDEHDDVVGYFASHTFEAEVDGKPAVILRGEAGLRRRFRGGASNTRFGVAQGLRALLRHPGRPIYYLGCLVHPSSYYNLAKHVRRMWPSRHAPMDEARRQTISRLGDAFGLPRVGDDPLVRHVGWRTHDSDVERAYWMRCAKPDVRFFVEANPGYHLGHGLLTLVPLTPGTMRSVASAILRERTTRRYEDVVTTLQQVPGVSRSLGTSRALRCLRQAPLFSSLSETQLEALASWAELVTVRAGTTLIEEGDDGDELYVLQHGSVHVTVGRGDEAVLVDQLDAGEMFGEVAALTGERRTATARTASRSSLLRLRGVILREAMAADSALREAIWWRFIQSRFAAAADAHPALAPLPSPERHALVRSGEMHALPVDHARRTARPGFVFVAQGLVRIEHRDGTRASVSAPGVRELGADVRLVAEQPSHIVHVPTPAPRSIADDFRHDPLLSRLPAGAIEELLDPPPASVDLDPDQLLFQEGDPADAFFLVRSGAVDVTVRGEVVARLVAGETFGDRALDPSGPRHRTATVRAVGPTSLLKVTDDRFMEVAGELFADASAPDRAKGDLPEILGAAWAQRCPATMMTHEFAAGEVILREGEPSDTAWYLVRGTARAERGGAVVGRMHAGSCFGERGLLMEQPRAATVVAETSVVASSTDAKTFVRWYEAHPDLRDVIASLELLRPSAGESGSTTVHRGTHDGAPCVTAVTRLPEGGVLTATKLEQSPVLILSLDDGADGTVERVDFERAPAGERRQLAYRGRRPLSVRLEGNHDSAAVFRRRLLEPRPLTRGELERFRWTGRLGRPEKGPNRLLCGCVGLTRRDLSAAADAGCRGVEEVTTRTGAGSVCGSCVPLVRRLLDGAEETPAHSGRADEMSLDEFEARLDEVRDVDTRAALLGPQTTTWRIFGESVLMLGGLRALMLQFAHPLVQGLIEHSTMLQDAPNRVHRTLQYMFGITFGEGAELVRLAREVHEKHARVSGIFKETHGKYRAGTRYSANQIELLKWVAATLVEGSIHTYEQLVRPLSIAEKDSLVVEGIEAFSLFGIPRDRFETDWSSFREYFDAELASDNLYVGDDARALAHAVMNAPAPQARVPLWVVRVLTTRWMPPRLRDAYGLDYGPAIRASAAALQSTIRAAVPRMPHHLRVSPARLHAERRLRGERGPDPTAATLERLIAWTIGADA